MRFERQQFRNRINHLFLKKACLQTRHTKIAPDSLKKPRVVQVPGHGVRTLGSHAASDQGHVHKALARMRNRVNVTKQISATVFLNTICCPRSTCSSSRRTETKRSGAWAALIGKR